MSHSRIIRDAALMSAAELEQATIDALRAASPDESVPVTRDSAVLDLVDSLGLIVALGHLQAALAVELAPKQRIELFRARSIADLAATLGRVVAMRAHASQPEILAGSPGLSAAAPGSDESQMPATAGSALT